MKNIKLAKALNKGKVFVRNKQTGQLILKFRIPGAKDRIIPPYAQEDEHQINTYINLCTYYTPEQLKNSNLEELLSQGDLALLEL